jgi:eukaryotic-like serine/threonine-protein kinase
VLDRPVAVKLLATRFAADEAVRRRFRREALAAARLSGDSNAVTIFDVGEWRGTPFIVMEYLGGGTLEQVLRGGAQPPAQALQWLEQAARSLDAAHALGVVHRDVKPANLLLGEDGRLRVGDFGIATAAGLDSLTLTGTVLGTAGYLSPEQAHGRPVTAATDGYALGVVAFELLTGKRPFERDSPTAEATAHAYEPVPSAAHRNPGLREAVDSVFATALAKDPAARFPSCLAFVSALRSACSSHAGTITHRLATPALDPPTRIIHPRRRLRPAVVAGAALVLLSAAGLAGALLTAGSSPHPQAASTTTLTRTTTVIAPPTTSTAPPPPASSAASAGASDLNTRGYRLMLAGNYAAALHLLQQAVAGLADPTNPVTAYANFNLGQTLVQLGQCSSAVPYLQRAAQLEPARQEARAALRYAEQCTSQHGQAGDGGPAAPPGHTPGHDGNGDQGD